MHAAPTSEGRPEPHLLALRGRRLVFDKGVYALALLTGILLILFGGITDRLIPLYAVGAFLAFTLSQAGMVRHCRRVGGPGWRRKMGINGVGALATGITVAVVLAAKFTEGAWITVLLIPALMLFMRAVRQHGDRVQRAIAAPEPIERAERTPPLVVVPIERWDAVSAKALRFAWTISADIVALHVESGDGSNRVE